jgi:hypothetical protein
MSMSPTAVRRLLAVLACFALFGGACSGPREPVEVSVREFPTDVILGAQGVSGASAPQLVATPEGPALVIRPPLPSRQSGPTDSTSAPAGPCPAAHPFDAPKDEAPSRASAPPVASSYRYRNSGTFEYRGASSSNGGVFPAQSSRTLRGVQRLGTQADSPYRFEIMEGLAGITTTTTYHVTPATNVPGDAGLFIAEIETIRPNGPTEIFSPQPMIKIFEFPAMGNLNWKSSGADPRRGSSMTIQGRIGIDSPDGEDAGTEPDLLTRARVDACGQVVDAWLVEIGGPSDTAKPDSAGGTILGPGVKNLRLKAVYAIATQFGAFSVYDKYEITGTETNGQTVKLVNEATISEYPKLPR